MFPQHQNSRQKGFTLTEAAIVLGIVGLILGSIWVAAAAVYKNMRVSTTSNQILQIVQSVRSMHATSSTVDTSLSAIKLASAGAIPKDMVDDPTSPTSVRNVWGGAVSVASATVSVAGDSFTVTYPNVPREACVDLLVRNTGAGRDSGLVNAGGNGGITANNSANMPISVTTALGNCGSSTTTSVQFTFMLKS